MADNVTVDNGSLTDYIVSSDEASSGQVQRVKLSYSANGSDTHVTADADGLLVNLGTNNDVTITGSVTVADGGGSVTVDDGGLTISVDDGGGTLTVDNGTLSVVGGGTEATALRVTLASDSTGVLSVDDNGATLSVDDGGGTLTIDGTVSISGTVTVDSELPPAAALADNASNPTAPAVGAFTMVWDGSTWDRAPGTAADGLLVNLGGNNDVSLNAGTNNVGDVDVETFESSGDTTMQNAATATGNGTVLTTTGYGTAIVQVTGTFSATITFEGTADGTNYHAISATQLGAATIATTATTTGIYRLSVSGLTNVRARISAYSSGSVTAVGRATNAPYGTKVVNAVQSGTWTLGTITPGTAASSLGKAEDAAHASGDTGVAVWGVRNDSGSTSFGANGDYTPLAVDANGRVGIADLGGSVTVDGTVTANAGTGTFAVQPVRASTPAQSSPTPGTSSTSILASNANRIGATIYNDSAATCYVKLGATASTTSFTVKLAQDDLYEVPYGYTGAIDGITASGTATLRVTELT